MNEAYQLRTACRLCLSKALIKVVDLPPAIPGEHLKASPKEPDPTPIPIDLYQCADCGHVQILHVPPLEMLFNREYTFMPGNNPDLVAHFRATIDYFAETFTKTPGFAFELGSNDGVFLDELRRKTGCRVLGMDPALAPAAKAEERGVETLLEFFCEEQAERILKQYGQPDLVVANNVFAHNDDLRGMISGIAKLLKPGGYFMFEASWLKAVVEKYLIGTIIHEHLSVHSLTSLKPCLAEFGLQLVGVRQVDEIQGGAIIGVAQKTDSVETPAAVLRAMEAEKAARITTPDGLADFKAGLDQRVRHLHAEIEGCLGDRKIVGYGAARSAPFIIDVLHMADRLSCVVDDNPVKKGKFLPRTNIPIVGSREVVSAEDQRFGFLVLGWAQTRRIVEKLRNQYGCGYAITIYPDFSVVDLSKGTA